MSLDIACEKVVAVDPLTLPPAVRAAMVSQPLFVVPLRPVEAGFEIESWVGLPDVAPQDLFPKLSIKSWRDSGSLQTIARGMPLPPVVKHLLSHPTAQQRAISKAWVHSGMPLTLRLYPSVDFSNVSETRWLVGPAGTSFVSACQRGASAPRLGGALASMRQFAARIAKGLPQRSHIIELALFPDGEVLLVEVNPALQPREVDAVLRAA